MNAAALLTIKTFAGLNTNAARGTHEQPTVLENVYLDRTGGYCCQYTLSSQQVGVVNAVSAARGNNLFIEGPSNLFYYDPTSGTPVTTIPGSTGANLGNSSPLMPDLLLSAGGLYYILPSGLITAGFNAPTVGESGTQILWSYVDASGGGYAPEDVFDGTKEYEIGLEFMPADGAPFRDFVTFKVGAGHGTVPATFVLKLQTADQAHPAAFNVYQRQDGEEFAYMRSSGFVVRPGAAGPAGLYSPGFITGRAPSGTIPALNIGLMTFQPPAHPPAAYHEGRVWLMPTTATRKARVPNPAPGAAGVSTTVDVYPGRLYYSEVIASATPTSLPRWSAAQYIDVPFKVSRRVVALLSVGHYLYIFGDRELLIYTGDPEYGGRLEQVGDSIGAVAAGSVQQLGGIGYWLSDSGVMAVQGGQVKEVGADVRDLLAALNPATVTSTVDFRREIYTLTDGVKTLLYHARENGWTTRAQGNSGTLISGGGTPYVLSGTTLYTMGGEFSSAGSPPSRLTATMQWGPFECGSWTQRKTFAGLAVGVDLSSIPATLTQNTVVYQDNQAGGTEAEQSDTQTVVITPPTSSTLTHIVKDEVTISGQAIQPQLTWNAQDVRGILRPPLVIYGSGAGEVPVK